MSARKSPAAPRAAVPPQGGDAGLLRRKRENQQRNGEVQDGALFEKKARNQEAQDSILLAARRVREEQPGLPPAVAFVVSVRTPQQREGQQPRQQ